MPTAEELAFQGRSQNILIQPQTAGYVVHAFQKGVVTFRKDYPGGSPDYVTQVNLKEARVISVIGPTVNPGLGQGVFGGNNPELDRLLVFDFWGQAVNFLGARAFAAINAGFFNTVMNPTPLAFPLKQRRQIVSDGYGSTTEYQAPLGIRILKLKGSTAKIESYPDSNAMGTDLHDPLQAPHMIAGLATTVDKSMNSFVGRTFIGLAKAHNGLHYTLMIFSSAYASQAWAENVLINDFLCVPGQLLMLDGGGSTQLTIQGQQEVSSARTVPHVLVVASL